MQPSPHSMSFIITTSTMCNPCIHNSLTNTDGVLFISNEHTADKLFCELFCSKGIHSNVFVKNVQETISSVHYKL